MKDKILLDILKGKDTHRPAVWLMRQAGRYLPGYKKLRQENDFFKLTQTPELVKEITLEPIKRFDMDAAIIFSDILVIIQALGLEVEMKKGFGPFLPKTIENEDDINNLDSSNIENKLKYVFDSIKLTRENLNEEKTLIGFAGAPFTIMCYMIEGKGSKSFDNTRIFCFKNRKLAHKLLKIITKATIDYLKGQIKYGADCVQIFDSWAGILSEKDFDEFILPYTKEIVDIIKPLSPIIVFEKGRSFSIEKLSKIGASALALDWNIEPKIAREKVGKNLVLQGNFDPAKLFLEKEEIEKEVKYMIKDFGEKKYIVNLGHGIIPSTPVSGVESFVNTVKNYKND